MTVAEIQIEAYESFLSTDTMGRGVCIYVKEVLKGTQWSYLDKNMCRVSVWVEVPLENKDRLLVGAIYRSINSDDQRNENINNLVAKAADQSSATC